ncbi:MAG: AAA+ family ATPase, partial [Chroococcidiopsis sp.]
VTRLAQDRAEQQERDKVWDEITRRLREDKQRGEFAGVHRVPDSSADVPDEMAVRLVVLGPQHPHKSKETDTPARVRAEETLQHKGASPRYCKNMLLFLAPDKAKLELLERAVCQYLAWDSIVREKEALELGVFQSNQATTKQQQTDKDVKNLIQEAYIWLLVPTQPDPHAAIEWQEIRLHSSDSPIVQASRKAVHEEHLMANYAASRLRLEALDPYLWRDVNHLDLKKLWEYLAYYLYLPRLRDEKVLLAAVEMGVAELLWNDHFAYATGWDESKGRYLGLTAGKHINATLSSQSLIVKPEIAQRQFEADRAAFAITQTPQVNDLESGEQRNKGVEGQTSREVEEKTGTYDPSSVTTPAGTLLPKRFYGSIKLDALRLRRDAGQIADEVIQHFASLVGAEVEITLEVQASIPNGVPDNVVRTVNENCRVLKFTTQEFEHE